MKKAFESGKIWTILSAVIFVMMCGLVVLATRDIPPSRGGMHWFYNYRSYSMKDENGVEMLTAEHWNEIMSGLDSMVLPRGAIMAFTGACPDGWSHLTAADGKFLMGVNNLNQVMDEGGSNEVFLEADNLPPHSHYIRFGDTLIKYGDDANKRTVVVDWDSAKYPWNAEYEGNRHNMQNSKSYSFHDVKTAPYGTIPTEDSNRIVMRSNSGATSPKNAVNITNKFVKVNFCIKD